MADKKLTEVDTSTSLADSDKLIGNIGNSVKQITLTNLVTIIKNKIGSLKNPNKLKFTGAVTNEYDGSKEVTINIPENSGGSYTLPTATSTTLGGVKPVSKTSEMSQDVGVDENGKLYTVPGNGNDGLSVSYDEETQTLKFTSSSGGGSDLKNLLSNTVRYIEVDGEILGISNEKQWTKIAEITVQENDSVYEHTDLDNLTEIFIYTVGLNNISTTGSGMKILINDGVSIGSIDTQTNTGTDTKYQRLYLKYNGLYWETRKTPFSNNENNYYDTATNLLVPYSVKLGVGKCTKLKMMTNAPQYNLKSGTIYIYGR